MRLVFSSTNQHLISHNRPLFHPEVNIMLLIFSSTNCFFGLLVWWLCHLLFLSWIIVCPLFCISHYLPCFAILDFSSIHNIIDLFFHPLEKWCSLPSTSYPGLHSKYTNLNTSTSSHRSLGYHHPRCQGPSHGTASIQGPLDLLCLCLPLLRIHWISMDLPIDVENLMASAHCFKSPELQQVGENSCLEDCFLAMPRSKWSGKGRAGPSEWTCINQSSCCMAGRIQQLPLPHGAGRDLEGLS